MLKKILESQAKTQKRVAKMSMLTPTQKLKLSLLRDLKRRNISAKAIKVGKAANVYPIGNIGVYRFATFGKATDSQKWKLYEYFHNNKNN